MLSAFTLSAAMFFGIVAMAADLPKEGTFSCTYYGFGTSKATKVGEERLLVVFDENGLTLSNGFLDLSQRVNVALKGSIPTEQIGALALRGLTHSSVNAG
jgi:hypothetical protein